MPVSVRAAQVKRTGSLLSRRKAATAARMTTTTTGIDPSGVGRSIDAEDTTTGRRIGRSDGREAGTSGSAGASAGRVGALGSHQRAPAAGRPERRRAGNLDRTHDLGA